MCYGDRLADASAEGYSGFERDAYASSGVPLGGGEREEREDTTEDEDDESRD